MPTRFREKSHILKRLGIGLKAIKELGLTRLYHYIVYKAGLALGIWKFRTPAADSYPDHQVFTESPDATPQLLNVPDPNLYREFIQLYGLEDDLLSEANEILERRIRLFGGFPQPLSFEHGLPLGHWTQSEKKPHNAIADIKLIWEPCRLGWAYVLARAYHYTNDSKYIEGFWELFEEFRAQNPPNAGPNWSSAQEVALRLIAMVFVDTVFQEAPEWDGEKQRILRNALFSHVERIPPTLSYAKAQNNNHLLSEVLGMFTAGCTLPDHPRSRGWLRKGWRWINKSLQEQISPEGVYAQHSMNYHRFMLQLSLLAYTIGNARGLHLSQETMGKLRSATLWLLTQIHPATGETPNTGPNDGSYPVPLTQIKFSDFRPVAQAASIAFLGKPAFPPGPWDEFSLWLGLISKKLHHAEEIPHQSTAVLTLSSKISRGFIRAVRFDGRPGHADQLHVDLWMKDLPIALDPGTYSYNNPYPWDNRLSGTDVHNTVMIQGKHQMTRAGKFLWLDRAQASVVERTSDMIAVEHNGYREYSIIHRRTLKRTHEGWEILDQILPLSTNTMTNQQLLARVQWLVPDWEYEIQNSVLTIFSPLGKLSITIAPNEGERHIPSIRQVDLIRAGQNLIGGENTKPYLGWYSPTYYTKVPALAFHVTLSGIPPYSFCSIWKIPAVE